MGELSANLLAALQQPNAQPRILIEMDFVDGTERWSKHGVNSVSLGPYERRISKLGEYKWAWSGHDGSLYLPENSLTIVDQDRRFDKRVSAGQRLRGIATRHYLAERYVAPADWFKLFDGMLQNWDRDDDLGEYSLKMRCDDAPMSRPFPQVTIDPADWPNAPRDNWGKTAPVLLGRHDSSGLGSRKGAVDAILVDTVANGWIISYGRCMSIDRVFDGDTKLTAAQLPTITLDYEVNGRIWTYFETSTARTALRVDCLGVDSIGDGTGFLLQADTDVLLFALCNFVFAQNTTGNAWVYAHPRVDIAATGSSEAGISARFDGAETAYAYLGRWLVDHPDFRALWTPSGKVKLVSDPIRRAPWGSAYPYDVLLPPDVQSVKPGWPREDPIGRLFTALGSGKERLEVADALDPDPTVDTMDASAGPDYI